MPPRRPLKKSAAGGRRRKKKPCAFCADLRGKIIDYKNLALLSQYVDERSRIRKARQTGNCRRHQSRLASAIKRAREMALIAYIPQ